LGKGALEMNTTVNIFVVQLIPIQSETPHKLVGVYSTRELADAAAEEALEFYDTDRMQSTIIILALDDIINGVHRSEPVG
jgi:hypothetical protein